VLASADGTRADTAHPRWVDFLSAFYEALGTVAGQMALARKVLSIFVNDVRINSSRSPKSTPRISPRR
jgi:hypothetical protein